MSQAVHSQKMVEVFKTDVTDQEKAKLLIVEIQKQFVSCRASFDLEDCDRVLVVRSMTDEIDPLRVIDLLNHFKCEAMILPD